jgi:CNT family concentrative nucleoside transporter
LSFSQKNPLGVLCVLLGFVFLISISAANAQSATLAVAHIGPPFATQASARMAEHGTFILRLRSLLGLAVFACIAYGVGQIRRRGQRTTVRLVLWGFAIQFVFAFLVLDTTPGRLGFAAVSRGVAALLDYTKQGASFVFGDLALGNNIPVGTPLGDPLNGPVTQATAYAHVGGYFAFYVLPTIVFFCALTALFYYSGVMQKIIQGIAWVMQRSMGTSGAETLAAATNIFVGQTEAPLMVKPFLARATNSELMAIMTAGFANIASGVLAAYAAMLGGFFPDAAGHLLAASLLSAPSSLVVAKLIFPETTVPETEGTVKITIDRTDVNAVDALTRGSLEGLQLALNVGAVLIVFIAVIALLNALIGWVGHFFGVPTLSFQQILGWIATPFAWLTGMPWHDALQIGPLLGLKTAVNEFVAYLQMSQTLATNPHFVSPRSAIIAIYALCGFANFSSVAIQVGGISGMAPHRRSDLSRLGLLAMFGGALSSLMAACVVGVLL